MKKEKIKYILSNVTCHVLASLFACHLSHVPCLLSHVNNANNQTLLLLTCPLCLVDWFAKTLNPNHILNSKHCLCFHKKQNIVSQTVLAIDSLIRTLKSVWKQGFQKETNKHKTDGHCDLKTEWAQGPIQRKLSLTQFVFMNFNFNLYIWSPGRLLVCTFNSASISWSPGLPLYRTPCNVQYQTGLYCTLLTYIILYSTEMSCTGLYYTALYCTALYYIRIRTR